ncbi:hypothetical protein NEIRO03_2267 [Nematocida sp. AWRm78]|nr:hypothetical protein NEIRO03_2267 [Nematocida sp. AWRm78]
MGEHRIPPTALQLPRTADSCRSPVLQADQAAVERYDYAFDNNLIVHSCVRGTCVGFFEPAGGSGATRPVAGPTAGPVHRATDNATAAGLPRGARTETRAADGCNRPPAARAPHAHQDKPASAPRKQSTSAQTRAERAEHGAKRPTHAGR